MEYQKLDTDFKVKWLAALRSGRYKQGHGVLRSKYDRYCCLGVACVVAGVEWREGSGNYIAVDGDSQRVGYLPLPLQDRIGLSSDASDNLVVMNDCGSSFAEIADFIEQQL